MKPGKGASFYVPPWTTYQLRFNPIAIIYQSMQPNNQADSNIGESFPEPASGLAGTLISAAFFRLALNTARRFVYPFAPALSRGLNVPLTAITSLIAVNLTTSIFGLYTGPLADRVGYRVMMIAGLAIGDDRFICDFSFS